MKKKGGLILSFGVSIAAIIWVVQKVNIQSVAQAMKQTHFLYWISAILIYLLGFFPRGLRWQLMLSKIKFVSFADATQIVILGYAANNLLPFRLGEIVRAYVMGIKNNLSKITCLGSIGAERVIDGLILVSFLGLSMISLSSTIQQVEKLKQLLVICGTIFLSSVLLLMLALIYSDKILQRGKRIFGQFGMSVVEKLIHSLQFLRTQNVLYKIIFLSIAVWLIEGAMFVLIAWDMGLKDPIAAGYFFLGIINLGILLPSAPGYIGVYQAASVFAFLALGYSKSMGLAYGLLIHLAQYLPITIVGVLIFISFGYRFRELYKTVSYTTQE